MKSVSKARKNNNMLHLLHSGTKARMATCFKIFTIFSFHTQKSSHFPFLLGSSSRKNNTIKADQNSKGKMEDDCST